MLVREANFLTSTDRCGLSATVTRVNCHKLVFAATILVYRSVQGIFLMVYQLLTSTDLPESLRASPSH